MNAEVQRIVGRLSGLSAAADELSRVPPMGPQFLTQVGRAYTLLGAHDRAEPFLRRAWEAAPFDASNNYNLGAALVFLGRFDEAKQRLAQAVKIQPRHFPAWYTLVDLERQTVAANHIEALTRLFEDGTDPDGSRTLHAGHALAKTYEDLGDYEAAFDWLVKAKAARRARAAFSDEHDEALFAAAADTLKHGRGGGYPSDEPIFVVGLPRTGTTLVESILAAHPDVTAGGELGILPALTKHFSGGAQRPLMDAANFDGMANADLGEYGRAYVESTRPVAGRTPRFTDKTPINMLYAGLIHRALPNARIVCVRRDPMDSVISFFRMMFFASPHVYPSVYDLEHAARHYVRFHGLADFWRDNLPADRYREQSYEALVADQEVQTRELLAFAGLGFDAAVLNFHEHAGVVATASAVQVRKPIYSSALGRWKRYGKKLKPAADILRAAGIEVEDV